MIRREYLQRVRSRWFLLSTLGGPLLVAAGVALPTWLSSREEAAGRRFLLVDQTGVLGEPVARRLEEAGLLVERQAGDEPPPEEARGRVLRRELGGIIVLDAGTLESGRVALEAARAPSALRRLAIQGAVARSAMERRLGGAEPGVTALLAGGTLELSLLEEEAALDEPVIMTAWVGAFLLYIVLLVYAVAVMRSVLEEKTSRVVEVVISSIRPWQLMLGKILGVGAVGLTQLAVWSLAVALIFALALPSLTAARPELAQLAELRRFAPGAGYLALFGVFFLCGYFIYAALYAAVGAMCNSDEEAQQAQLPLMFLVVAPILLLMPVLERPNGVAAVVLSLVPFFSPVLMFARAAGGVAPVWQVALSFLLMALTVLGVAWVAGRIYRVGILMAGKRPTLAELLRWVREA